MRLSAVASTFAAIVPVLLACTVGNQGPLGLDGGGAGDAGDAATAQPPSEQGDASVDGATPAPSCLTDVPCSSASQCVGLPGTSCNQSLAAPRCQREQCGAAASPCSSSGQCQPGLSCSAAKVCSADPLPSGVCAGNLQSSGDLLNATCQAKLNAVCCAELKGCFNLVVQAGTADCNAYAKCTAMAGTAGSPAAAQAAQAQCDQSTSTAVLNAYDAIVACAAAKASAECK
jgi:hypothetical protein